MPKNRLKAYFAEQEKKRAHEDLRRDIRKILAPDKIEEQAMGDLMGEYIEERMLQEIVKIQYEVQLFMYRCGLPATCTIKIDELSINIAGTRDGK